MGRLRMTFEEYLAFERASVEKHEYANGEVYLRSEGPSPRGWSAREHDRVVANVLGVLRGALAGRPSEVHGPAARIRAADGSHHQADAFVVWEAPVFADEARDAILNPKAIVEVLSDATARHDRGDKFASYRTIDTLVEYVLVSQETVRVEHFHRVGDGSWLFCALGPGEMLVLPSLGCEIAVDRVYLKVFAKD